MKKISKFLIICCLTLLVNCYNNQIIIFNSIDENTIGDISGIYSMKTSDKQVTQTFWIVNINKNKSYVHIFLRLKDRVYYVLKEKLDKVIYDEAKRIRALRSDHVYLTFTEKEIYLYTSSPFDDFSFVKLEKGLISSETAEELEKNSDSYSKFKERKFDPNRKWDDTGDEN